MDRASEMHWEYKALLLFVVTGLIVYFISQHHTAFRDNVTTSFFKTAFSNTGQTQRAEQKRLANNRTILIWTAMFGETLTFTPNQQPLWLKGCPQSRCVFTTNHTEVESADAVFLSMTDMGTVGQWPIRTNRKGSQYYVFYIEESPATTVRLVGELSAWKDLSNFFNLTMTYRSDSDIPTETYFADYEPHVIDTKKRDRSWFVRKKDYLWVVSNCNPDSKRDDYARQLSKYISFDQYGKCNNRQPNCTDSKCMKSLMEQYKFYFSFENSMCFDHAVWRLPNSTGLVNARWCKLCEILHRRGENRIVKSYPDILRWFTFGQCRSIIKLTNHTVKN